MKFRPILLLKLVTSVILVSGQVSYSQSYSLQSDSIIQETKLSKKEKKAEKKQKTKEYLEGRRWRIATSFILANMNSSIGIEGPNGILGAKLSSEDLFGFKKQNFIPKFDMQYSFTKHSSLYVEYYNIARKSTYEVGEGFDWGDIEIPEDAGSVDLFLNTQIWSVGYMYSFINQPNAEISFFANIFVLGLYTGLDLEKQDIRSRFRLTAPFPSFGYRFSYEILPKVRFGGSHSFFFLKIGDYGGSINNMKLSLDYRVVNWVSIGFSYSKFDLNVSSEARTFKGVVEYDYEGPGLYLQFVF
jgi:hypothetical protein